MGGNQNIRITIMGGGAIGKLAAAKFIQAGMDATLLVRRVEQAQQLNEKGLVLIRTDGERIVFRVKAAVDMHANNPDVVILTVKSFDTEPAAKQVASLARTPFVLSMQNGLGNGDTLSRILGDQFVLLGLTTYGATSVSDCEVAERGEGELVLGGFRKTNPITHKLSAIFTEAGWNVRIGYDMQKEVWKKALVNIGINPITAIYRVTNGEIAKRGELKEIAVAAVKEAGNVAVALGVLTPQEAEEGIERMVQVAADTADNRSSMLQDVEKGRRTEIDSLNGAIVRLGEEMSVDTPVNRQIVEKMRVFRML
ncbi:ketopantoate reductase family protein [Effusibacillus consociatus]|uniref:2-dehydropantoate 2-reductase n=1 Tax=Effusibacillus consociatus TaxID=1117041 RepID=A0ABV9Q8M0_9BACL